MVTAAWSCRSVNVMFLTGKLVKFADDTNMLRFRRRQDCVSPWAQSVPRESVCGVWREGREREIAYLAPEAKTLNLRTAALLNGLSGHPLAFFL